jgi:luciferase family oxidoreductase group 1
VAALHLSVLDQSPIAEGSTGAEALRHTVELAQLAERLGYRRYWLAEHHGTPMLACSSPEILIGAVAAATSRIRVGSGGVMLVHYSPLKVAEVFSVLGGLHGDRIDLGVGRAPGTDAQTIFALQRDRRQLLPEDYREQVAELLAYFEDGFPPGHPFARLAQLPGAPGRAEVWLLGGSAESAVWAAEWGLRYSIADFINPAGGAPGALYREHFSPVRGVERPQLSVAVGAVCAETAEEAERLASSWRMAIQLAERGQFGPVPDVERSLRFLATEGRAGSFAGRRVVVGAPDTVRRELEAIAADYGTDELLVLTMTHDEAARRRSYELLADAFGLDAGLPGGRETAAGRG